MPDPLEFSEVSLGNEFSLQVRPKQGAEMQANETLKIQSTGNHALGEGGELFGIGKRDLGDFRQTLEARRLEYTQLAETRLAEIREEYTRQLNGEPPPSDQERTRLQNRINSVDRFLTPGQNHMDLGHFAAALPEHQHDEVLTQLQETQRMLRGGWNNMVGTVGPLLNEPIAGNEQNVDPEALHLLSRAVASSRVDRLLGTDSLATEKFGFDPDGRPIGISLGVDGVGVTGNLENGKTYFLEVDYASHEIQKGLYDLEALDYITGQIDRHPGNIFIDPVTGKVKGIDNDLAFPQVAREKMMADYGGCDGKPVLNKPLFVHEDTARKIENMNPDDLRRTLESVHYPNDPTRGRLTPEEIDGAVERLNEMKEHIRELRKTGHVVQEFNAQTFEEAVTHQSESFGEDINTTDKSQALSSKGKTSYVGSIAMERRKNELNIQEGVSERLDFEGVKTATNSTGKVPRSPERAEFSKLSRSRAQELRAEIAQGFDEIKAGHQTRLDAYQKRLNKLERPGFMDWLRSLRYGGVEGAKQAFRQKHENALQDLRSVDRQVEDRVNFRLEGENARIWERAKEKVALEKQTLKQSQNLGVQNSVQLDQIDGNKVENLEQDDRGLNRSTSVRDLMKETSVVQKAKEQLGGKLDLGEDNAPSTRNSVKLTESGDGDKPTGVKVK